MKVQRKRPQSAPGRRKKLKPEPFQMTLREEARAREMMEAMKSDYAKKDEVRKNEKKYRFQATKVPRHVRENRFEEIMRKKEERMKYAKEQAFEDAKLRMKPFSFQARDEKKYRMFSESSPELRNMDRANRNFTAKPFPEHVFTEYANEQMKEREGM